MKLTYEMQLRMNAIIGDLVKDGETFDGEAALELWESLPSTRYKPISLTAVFPKLFRGRGFDGVTNTGQRMSSGGDDEGHTRITTESTPLWIGSHAVIREDLGDGGRVIISSRFEETRGLDERSPAYMVVIDEGRASVMNKSELRSFNLGFGITFGMSTFKKWKKPRKASNV